MDSEPLSWFSCVKKVPFRQHPTDILKALARIATLNFGATRKPFYQDPYRGKLGILAG